MVDLVGIEPTTFPASRDALKLAVSKHLSVLESNDAISSSLTVVPVVALRSKSRIAPWYTRVQGPRPRVEIVCPR